MGILPYVVLAALILAMAVFLVWQGRSGTEIETEFDKRFKCGLLDRSGLDLAGRIFDPSDHKWLCEELGFRPLARSLARRRQEMALQWLRGLRKSFNELVRSPQPEGAMPSPHDNLSNWTLLFMTLRFHLLLGYAVLVVRLFGPYHRLVPSFGWLHSASGAGHQREKCGMASAGGAS